MGSCCFSQDGRRGRTNIQTLTSAGVINLALFAEIIIGSAGFFSPCSYLQCFVSVLGTGFVIKLNNRVLSAAFDRPSEQNVFAVPLLVRRVRVLVRTVTRSDEANKQTKNALAKCSDALFEQGSSRFKIYIETTTNLIKIDVETINVSVFYDSSIVGNLPVGSDVRCLSKELVIVCSDLG